MKKEHYLVYYCFEYDQLALLSERFQNNIAELAPEEALNEFLAFHLGRDIFRRLTLVGEL